jgi:hypothetical protein
MLISITFLFLESHVSVLANNSTTHVLRLSGMVSPAAPKSSLYFWSLASWRSTHGCRPQSRCGRQCWLAVCTRCPLCSFTFWSQCSSWIDVDPLSVKTHHIRGEESARLCLSALLFLLFMLMGHWISCCCITKCPSIVCHIALSHVRHLFIFLMTYLACHCL